MNLDKLWALCIFKKHGSLCQKCFWEGRISIAVDAHHGIHKDNGFLRYHLDNGVPLCRSCHDQDGTTGLKQWFKGWIGEERYHELKRLAHANLGQPIDECAVRKKLVNFLKMEI